MGSGTSARQGHGEHLTAGERAVDEQAGGVAGGGASLLCQAVTYLELRARRRRGLRRERGQDLPPVLLLATVVTLAPGASLIALADARPARIGRTRSAPWAPATLHCAAGNGRHNRNTTQAERPFGRRTERQANDQTADQIGGEVCDPALGCWRRSVRCRLGRPGELAAGTRRPVLNRVPGGA